MVIKTEGQHAGEFIVSEGNGSISREAGTLLTDADMYVDGTVLVDDAAGKLARLTGDAGALGTGVEIAGILIGNWDASAGDIAGVPYLARLAEVNDAELTYPEESTAGGEKDAAVAALATLNIITR